MSKRAYHLALSAFLLGTVAPLSAFAAPPSADQAVTIERQIRDWMTDFVGPNVPVAARPARVTASGDHYQMAIPLGGLMAALMKFPSGSDITGDARQADNGIWTIDNIRIPSPMRVVMTPPAPPGGDQQANTTVVSEIRFNDQKSSATYDPSFTAPSVFTIGYGSADVTSTGPGAESSTHVGKGSTETTLRPATGNRVDYLSTSTVSDYRITQTMPTVGQIAISMGRLSGALEMDALSRERVSSFIKSIAAVAVSGPMGSEPTPAQKKMLVDIISSLRDFTTAFKLDEMVEGLKVAVGGKDFSLDQFRFALSGDAPGGILSLHMTLGATGLDLPDDLPIGPAAEFVPQTIELRPFLTGASVEDVTRLATAAAENTPPDIASLFSHGGIIGGLESFTITVGKTEFNGRAKVTMPQPGPAVTAEGQVTATNLDALIERLKESPELSQVLAALVFAKGIGRATGATTTWDVTYSGGKVLVNGTDVSAMAR